MVSIPVMQSLERVRRMSLRAWAIRWHLGEHLAAGPGQIRDRLPGRMTRIALADIKGCPWSSHSTSRPRSLRWLPWAAPTREEYGVADRRARHRHHLRRAARAPFEMTTHGAAGGAARRYHAEDLERFAEELAVATQAS